MHLQISETANARHVNLDLESKLHFPRVGLVLWQLHVSIYITNIRGPRSTSYLKSTVAFSPGRISWSVKLSIHLRQIPILRMHLAKPPLKRIRAIVLN
jgi:hypothetical protein